jgi:hypothetical protein
MSTQNINISPSNVKGRCDLKCSYSFKYSESNSTAKNNGVVIDLTYDSTSTPPVNYNNGKNLNFQKAAGSRLIPGNRAFRIF